MSTTVIKGIGNYCANTIAHIMTGDGNISQPHQGIGGVLFNSAHQRLLEFPLAFPHRVTFFPPAIHVSQFVPASSSVSFTLPVV